MRVADGGTVGLARARCTRASPRRANLMRVMTAADIWEPGHGSGACCSGGLARAPYAAAVARATQALRRPGPNVPRRVVAAAIRAGRAEVAACEADPAITLVAGPGWASIEAELRAGLGEIRRAVVAALGLYLAPAANQPRPPPTDPATDTRPPPGRLAAASPAAAHAPPTTPQTSPIRLGGRSVM
jgi:hypothetical protein